MSRRLALYSMQVALTFCLNTSYNFIKKKNSQFVHSKEEGLDLLIQTLIHCVNQTPNNRTITTRVVKEFLMYQEVEMTHKNFLEELKKREMIEVDLFLWRIMLPSASYQYEISGVSAKRNENL